MACGDTNSGCGGSTETKKFFSYDNLKYILNKLSGKICLAVGSIKTTGVKPMHLDKTLNDEGGIIITSTIDEATTTSAGAMSATDKQKLDEIYQKAIINVDAEGESPLHLEADEVAENSGDIKISGSVDEATPDNSGVITAEESKYLRWLAGIAQEFDYIQEEVDTASGRYRNTHIATPVYGIAWLKNDSDGNPIKVFGALYPEGGSDVFFSGWNKSSSTSGDFDGSDAYMKEEGVEGAVLTDRLFYCKADGRYYYWDGEDLSEFIPDIQAQVDTLQEIVENTSNTELSAIRKAYPSDAIINMASNWFDNITGAGHFVDAVVMDVSPVCTTENYGGFQTCKVRFTLSTTATGVVNVWSNSDKVYLAAAAMGFVYIQASGATLNLHSFDVLIPYYDGALKPFDTGSKYYIDTPL